MTLQEMIDRTIERLDEVAGAPIYWTNVEIVDAINEAQRFFALLTLCLEKKISLALAIASAPFYSIISHPTTPVLDFIVPLSASFEGVRLRPATISQLNALDPFWPIAEDTPTYYAVLGCDLLAVYPHDEEDAVLDLTYAASPATMTLSNTGASPEIPAQYHPVLPDYAQYRLMTKVGGQEFANEVPKLQMFLQEATKCGQRIRKKMLAQGYDQVPFGLTSRDISPLMRQLMTVKLAKQPKIAA